MQPSCKEGRLVDISAKETVEWRSGTIGCRSLICEKFDREEEVATQGDVPESPRVAPEIISYLGHFRQRRDLMKQSVVIG